MQFTKKDLGHSKFELTVTIEATEMNSYFDEAAKNLSKDLTIKGFRPGNVPVDVLEQTVGSQKLFEEAANIAARKSFPEIILKNKIEAIGTPNIQILKIARGSDFEYKAEVTVLPNVELPDYKKIASGVSKNKVTIGDKEVDDALKYLRKSRAKFVTVKREAKEGDRVEIDFTTSVGGVKIENGESKNHPLIIGDNLFFEDFEKKLIGLKEGEEKEFQVKFPKDFRDKKLAGQSPDFKVAMRLVQEVELPEINNDFAKSFGDFESIDLLKKSVKDGLLKEKEAQEDQKWQSEVIQKISEKCKVEIPEMLINSELEKMMEGLENNAKSSGLKFEDYLKYIGKTIDQLKEENKKQAEKMVKDGLTLKAIADKENIEVSEKEIEEKINKEILRQYKSIEEAKKNVDMPRLMNYYYGIMRNEKTIQLLKDSLKK